MRGCDLPQGSFMNNTNALRNLLKKEESKMRFRISLNLQNSYHLEIVHVIVNSQLVGSCQLAFSNL